MCGAGAWLAGRPGLRPGLTRGRAVWVVGWGDWWPGEAAVGCLSAGRGLIVWCSQGVWVVRTQTPAVRVRPRPTRLRRLSPAVRRVSQAWLLVVPR